MLIKPRWWPGSLSLFWKQVKAKQATVDISSRTANDLGEMISSYLGNGEATVGRKFALAMYHELKVWLAEDGSCDHAVNVCYCSDRNAVHQLGVLLRQEYPTCLFCEGTLPAFDMILHPKCEGPFRRGEDTD